nr:MAG TPA: hypothetical protein [Crassvirales sp.]
MLYLYPSWYPLFSQVGSIKLTPKCRGYLYIL